MQYNNDLVRACRPFAICVVLLLGASLFMSMQMVDNELMKDESTSMSRRACSQPLDEGCAVYCGVEESGGVLFNGNPDDACHIVISKQSQALSLYDSRGDTHYYEALAIDNFGRIAVMHSTTRDKIIELNSEVNSDKLVKGQIVRVR